MYHQLLKLICPELGTSIGWVKANPRKYQAVRARQLAWAVMYLRFGYLYSEIGAASGHHRTTVIYGVKLVLSQRASSEDGQLLTWLMTVDVESPHGEDLDMS